MSFVGNFVSGAALCASVLGAGIGHDDGAFYVSGSADANYSQEAAHPACHPEQRTCNKCRVAKVVSEYYSKRGHPEAICRQCKRNERRARYHRDHIASPNQLSDQRRKIETANTSGVREDRESQQPFDRQVSQQPKGSIEPTTATQGPQPKVLIEPESGAKWEPDYSIWQEEYGRSLSDVERAEIKSNLRDFFSVLIMERGKKRG